MGIDFHVKREIKSDIRRIGEILSTDIFTPEETGRNPFFFSALTELLILLRDLMYKSEEYAQRVAFTDDINVTEDVKDVTDLIWFVRNAVCHVDSSNHKFQDAVFTFNTIFGKGVMAHIGDTAMESEYEDEVCFFFGEQKIYLKRLIIRAFEEAKENLEPILD